MGYDTFLISNASINEDGTFDILLNEKRYAPKCLDVDPLTLEATWCQPLRTALDENFESPDFPPVGWQSTHDPNVPGWFRTGDGSVPGWTIPSWDSFYACSVGDQGSTGSGCCDYLITPPLDLRESEGYALFFDSYYDGAYGQLARVEYSLDAGSTWELLLQLNPDTSWVEVALDLSQFSGPGAEPQDLAGLQCRLPGNPGIGLGNR